MREVKYRAWDRSLEKMHHQEHMKTSQYYWFFKSVSLVRMQCIGLNDVNGTEIYEGDVLVHSFKDDKGRSRLAYDVIKYEDNDDYDYGGRCIGYNINGFWGDSFEVAGNIFENPELLEVDKHD